MRNKQDFSRRDYQVVVSVPEGTVVLKTINNLSEALFFAITAADSYDDDVLVVVRDLDSKFTYLSVFARDINLPKQVQR